MNNQINTYVEVLGTDPKEYGLHYYCGGPRSLIQVVTYDPDSLRVTDVERKMVCLTCFPITMFDRSMKFWMERTPLGEMVEPMKRHYSGLPWQTEIVRDRVNDR